MRAKKGIPILGLERARTEKVRVCGNPAGIWHVREGCRFDHPPPSTDTALACYSGDPGTNFSNSV